MNIGRLAVCLLFACACFTACNTGHGARRPLAKDLQGEWYKRYSGIAGGRQVVVNMHHYDDKTICFCYYPGEQAFTDLIENEGTDDTFSIYLDEYERAFHTDKFDDDWALNITGNVATGLLFGWKGKWKYEDEEKKPAPFTLKEDYPSGSYRLDVMIHGDSVEEKAGKDFAGAFSYYQVLLPTSQMTTEEAQFFMNTELHMLGGDSLGAVDTRDYIKKEDRKFFTGFRRELPDLKKIKIGGSAEEEEFNFEHTRNVFALYNEGGMICLELHDYNLSGKGNFRESSTYTCIDMKQKRGWQLNDMVDTANPEFSRLVRTGFMDQYNRFVRDSAAPLLTIDKVPLTANVFITGAGLYICYNPMVVVKNINEEICIYIPWTSIKGLLKGDFRKRMGLPE